MDLGLSKGWAYFVEEDTYKKYLDKYFDEVQEVGKYLSTDSYSTFQYSESNCQSHLAVNMADPKSRKGLAATRVETVDCAHHNMKLPGEVGDLQKGEK